MKTEPGIILPAELTQPGLYVRSSSVRCNCGNRWDCDCCRRAWIARRKRANLKWLGKAMDSDSRAWFCLFTVQTSSDFRTDVELLWDHWRELGRQRSLRRARVVQSGLGLVRRGVAALHLLNRKGGWQSHLHAVLIADRTLEPDVIIDNWTKLGGFADVEEVRSLGAVVHYSIAGPLPEDESERTMLARVLRGMRLVRRIGK